ncbi:MAG TPA: hypothetical protein VGR73_11815 [Bryobacteraceae bacterium]|nr:hypothetical protein [Bryobacteraceae bacterium]
MNQRVRLWLALCLLGIPAFPQSAPAIPAMQGQLAVPRRTCPGDPAGNLASIDCNFTPSQRWEQFVTGSVTDQALLGATFFGSIAQLMDDPAEWKKDWTGLGERIGARYAQNFAKGLTEYTFSAMLYTDPRHVSYANDPRIANHKRGVKPRIGHAFMDFLSVRRSSPSGDGRALPNVPLFAGAAASGFVGYAWYPDRLATPQQAAQRASFSLGTALAASFYNEFQPEVGRLLGAIFKRGKTPSVPAKAAGNPGGGE